MELGETAGQGACRETEEEAKAHIELGPLFSMIDVPGVEQIHIFYRARLLDRNFGPGTESLDVQLFRESEIPWDEIAFRTVSTTLRLFFEDRRRGSCGTYTRELPPARCPGKNDRLAGARGPISRGRQSARAPERSIGRLGGFVARTADCLVSAGDFSLVRAG